MFWYIHVFEEATKTSLRHYGLGFDRKKQKIPIIAQFGELTNIADDCLFDTIRLKYGGRAMRYEQDNDDSRDEDFDVYIQIII